jgi:hypothetical protein
LSWHALIDALVADIELILDRAMPRLLEQPSYHGADSAALRIGTRTNTELVLRHIRALQRPTDADPQTRATFVGIGEVRARQGIRADDMVQGWRICTNEVTRRAREILEGAEGAEHLLLQLFETMLPWSDYGMLASAEGHRQTELEIARREHHLRANFVRDLLLGELATSELRTRAEVFRLDTAVEYYAVRARPDDVLGPRRLERYLGTWDIGQRSVGLVALIDGDLCGFVSKLPLGEPPTAIGVAGPVHLQDLGPAFRRASRALETALDLGRTDVCDLASLGLHPAISADHDVGDALTGRYIVPLEALGASGRTMLETVERYIVNDRRLEATAQELHVHANTVRYRINRFEELTDCSLRSNLSLFETWWALQRRSLG